MITSYSVSPTAKKSPFANSFNTLDLFKVDCQTEELTQGQPLVILMMDISLEEDSQTSSVLRVYCEPLTSSTSEARLPSYDFSNSWAN